MDIAAVIGWVSGIFVVVMSLVLSADYDMVILSGIIDRPAILITFGGTLSCTFLAFPLHKIWVGLKAFTKTVLPPKLDPLGAIAKIIRLANLARREGILALEDAVTDMEDDFLKQGVMLVVDGTDPELVKNILETEISYIEERHQDAQAYWEFIASAGPAWGMIGTLIGLIMMLQNMDNLGMLGPSMALAITTTFYGSLIANFIANPIISKLRVFSTEELFVKELVAEGVLSIQNGENPRIIEEKLKAFLSPSLRESLLYNDRRGAE